MNQVAVVKKEHSRIGASSSDRWLNCPGSVSLADTMPPQPTSVYAAEGTAAHKLAELSLLNNTHPSSWLGETIDDFEVDEEMVDAVGVYFDTIKADMESTPGAVLAVEKKFNLSWLHPELFGTNDACLSEPFGLLRVYDYKHGVGIAVDAEDNSQLKMYGIGALELGEFNEVELVIVQPRCKHPKGSVRRWRITPAKLREFEGELKDAAYKATSGKGEYKAGEHCRFCPASGACVTLRNLVNEVAVGAFDVIGEDLVELPEPQKLDLPTIGKILDSEKLLFSWLESVKNYALTLAQSGTEIPGRKLVKKRAHRKWNDENEVLEKFKKEYGNLIFTNPKLKSPAQLEKDLGKKTVEGLFHTPDTGVTLASVNDTRTSIVNTGFEKITEQSN